MKITTKIEGLTRNFGNNAGKATYAGACLLGKGVAGKMPQSLNRATELATGYLAVPVVQLGKNAMNLADWVDSSQNSPEPGYEFITTRQAKLNGGESDLQGAETELRKTGEFFGELADRDNGVDLGYLKVKPTLKVINALPGAWDNENILEHDLKEAMGEIVTSQDLEESQYFDAVEYQEQTAVVQERTPMPGSWKGS